MLKYTLVVILMILCWALPVNKMYERNKLVNQIHEIVNSNIYLGTKIGEPHEYLNLIRYLAELQGGRVKMYVAGNGGVMQSAQNIVNAMKASKAKVDIIVYGDVASAHATIAISGDTMTVLNPDTIFIFHTPAATDKDGFNVLLKHYCEQLAGDDRGISKKLKCLKEVALQEKTNYSGLFNVNKQLLTASEWLDHENGDDILLTGKQIFERNIFKVFLGGTL